MALSTGYIAAAVPARIVRTGATTLFELAAIYLGDPLRWPDIARANGLSDPWISNYSEIAIPPVVDQSVTPTGILAA
jgi:hypothetical protein